MHFGQCLRVFARRRGKGVLWLRQASVTVIPLDSPSISEQVERSVIHDLVNQFTSDPAQCVHMQSVLTNIDRGEDLGKLDLLMVLRFFRWLNTQPDVPQVELDSYWAVADLFADDQVRCLMPHEIAEVFSVMADCNRRCPEFTQLLSKQCRSLARSFSIHDIVVVLRACGHMGYRSVGTISMFSRRIVQLLSDVETERLVTPYHLRWIVGLYPRLGIPWKKKKQGGDLDLWKAVAVALPSRLGRMTARDFAVILNAYAKLDFAFTSIHRNVMLMFETGVKHLVSLITPLPVGESDEEGFSPRDLALICNAYAKIQAGPFVFPLMRAASLRVASSIQECKPQDISNILNAFAKVEFSDHDVCVSAADAIIRHIADYSTQGLANVAHAYAKMGEGHGPLFDHVGNASLHRLDKFSPLQLGMLAYAFGRLKIKHRPLIDGLKDEVIYRGTIGRSLQDASSLYLFQLRSVEQLTQAFARFGVKDQRLLFVLFDMARQRVRQGAGRDVPREPSAVEAFARRAVGDRDQEAVTGRGLSILLSSFANSRADFHALVRWAPTQVLGLQGQLTTHELAMTFDACSRLGIKNRSLYRELIGQAKPRVLQMSPKTLALLVQAAARAGWYSRVLMRNATKVLTPRLRDLDGHDLCALLGGLSRMGYRDERFLRLLAAAVRQQAPSMEASYLVQALVAFSMMRIRHRKWFDAMLRTIFERQHELRQRSATNTVYSMLLIAAVEKQSSDIELGTSEVASVEDVYPFAQHQGVVKSLLGITNKHRSDLTYPAVFQLQIIDLFLRLLAPTVYDDLWQELKILLAKSRKVNVVLDDYMQNSSRMHRRISQWFTRVGLHHRSEVFVGPFMLDMVIGDKVVVEIDGPSHFYKDTNARTSPSILKTVILSAMGFRVRHLLYQEWSQCGTSEKKLMFCSSFWRDILAEDMNADTLPLLDVVESVLSSRAEMFGTQDLASGGEPLEIEGADAARTNDVPAFYAADDPDVAAREGTEVPRPSSGGFDIEKELSGARGVEELLAAHQAAEDQLVQDRHRGLGSQSRQNMQARAKSSTTVLVDGWERELLEAGGAGAKKKDVPRHVEGGAPDPRLRSLMPRDKRRVVVHRGASDGRVEEEEETDSSDAEA